MNPYILLVIAHMFLTLIGGQIAKIGLVYIQAEDFLSKLLKF